jgi:hypothetical protein
VAQEGARLEQLCRNEEAFAAYRVVLARFDEGNYDLVRTSGLFRVLAA